MFKNTIVKLTKSFQTPKLYFKDDLLSLSLGVGDNDTFIRSNTFLTNEAFIALIAGEVSIQNNKKDIVKTITTGESFVIPKNHDIRWRSFSKLLSVYLTYTPKTTETLPVEAVNDQIISFTEHEDTPWQETSDGFQKKVLYQTQNQKFTAGVWQGKDFKTDLIKFPYNEFILIKHGYLICTDEQGEEHQINVGEALFVPQGVYCAWQVKGSVSLHFAQIKP